MAQVRDSVQLIRAEVMLSGWAATGTTLLPFWLQTNRYGTAPRSAPAASLQAGVWKTYSRPDTARPTHHRFDWRFGVSAVTNAAAQSQLLLPEAYLAAKFGRIEVLAGRWQQLHGVGDSTLSSGFVAGSANALPIPKVQLSTRGYVPIGFLGKWLAINAGLGHGWFNIPYIQQSYLHQKYLYLRFGKPAAHVRVQVGLNHQVQWGGRADYLLNTPLAVDGKLPSALKYYPYIFFAVNPGEWENADFTSFDGAYRIGNHVGSIDFAVEARNRLGNWLLYHQHPYEDVTGLLFFNFPDGLTGLRWQGTAGRGRFKIEHIVAEFLTTMNQSGPTFDFSARFQGADNYFNHSQYREGWSYLGRSIGSPFVAPGTTLRADARKSQFFPNNRVEAGYVGARGRFGQRAAWTTRLAYSRSYGTYSEPYATSFGQFSGQITTQWTLTRWPGTSVSGSVAVDRGELLPPSAGLLVSLKKQW